jgi:geranylgeranyl diphosphate synthase type 3
MLHTSSLLCSPLPWSQAKGHLGSMMWKMGQRWDKAFLSRIRSMVFLRLSTRANYIYFYALRELEWLNNPQLFKIFYGNHHLFWLGWYETSWSIFIVDKGWIFSGEIVWLVPLKKNMSRWSTTKPAVSYVWPSNSWKHVVQTTCLSTILDAKISDYVPLVNLIGVLFQIRDDYQNLQDTQYTNNKGLCEDITEGKFSFPIIHAVLSRPDDRQLISTPPQK